MLNGGVMFYWRVKAEIKYPDINKVVIPELIVSLVTAEDANEAIIKVIDEFSQYDLFITSVKLCNKE